VVDFGSVDFASRPIIKMTYYTPEWRLIVLAAGDLV